MVCTLSCSAQSKGKGKVMDIATPNQTGLTVNLNLTGESLSLSYKFDNHSGAPVYLLNRLMDIDAMGNSSLNPNRVYIFPEGDDTLVLAKMLLKVPANLMVESPEIPGVTKIQNGQSFSENLTLPLPLRCDYPYPGKSYPDKTRMFKILKFQLGIMPDSKELRLYPSQCGEHEVQLPEYGQALQGQRISSSQDFNLEVKVLLP